MATNGDSNPTAKRERKFPDDLCEMYAEHDLAELDRILKEAEKELEQLKRRADTLEDLPAGQMESIREEFERIRLEEERLDARCAETEAKRDRVLETAQLYHGLATKLDEELKAYIEESVHKPREELAMLRKEARAAGIELQHAAARLKTVSSGTVFDVFEVDVLSRIPRIGGHRLGTTSAEPVEWAEINVALGQLTLLVTSLGLALGIKYEDYRPMPMGSHSYLLDLEDWSKLPLHFRSTFLSVSLDFDEALVQIAECVSELQHRTNMVSRQEVVYEWTIAQGKIYRDKDKTLYNIRHSISSKEEWTEAFRCLLVNLVKVSLVAQQRLDKQRLSQKQ